MLKTTHPPRQTGNRILVVEACPMTASGICTVIQQVTGRDDNIVLAACLSEIPALMRLHQPGLVVMEVCSEKASVLDGLKLIAQWHTQWPDSKLVVCTGIDEPKMLHLLKACGVAGIILKQEPAQALTQCLQHLTRGESFFSHKVRLKFTDPHAECKALKVREMDVLGHIFHGHNVKAVARIMQRDVRTISTHKRNAMSKLGFLNDGELFLQGKWMMSIHPEFTS
jgi:two-component system, NarL family, captular synthesis response regulator RcsB